MGTTQSKVQSHFDAAGTRVAPDNYRNMISDPSEVACP